MPFTTEQKRLFDAYYEKAKSMSDQSRLVALVYKMIELLDQADESYEICINPMHMGIHPKNRGGKKMQASTMQKKGHKIWSVGFVNQLCGPDRAVAFENDPLSNHCEDWTIKTTSGNKMFAQYKPGTVRGGSVGCSHLNQWLAAVQYGAESCYDDWTEDGSKKISKTMSSRTQLQTRRCSRLPSPRASLLR